MTYNHNSTLPQDWVEQIAEQGFDYLPELLRVMINAAMQVERQKYLGVGPYERSPERRDYANGYKPKTMKTRMGEVTFNIPQVREGDFYPEALEKRAAQRTSANLEPGRNVCAGCFHPESGGDCRAVVRQRGFLQPGEPRHRSVG